MRRILTFLILSAAMVLPVASWAGGMRVLLLLSDDAPPYQVFVGALKSALPGSIQLTRQLVNERRITPSSDLIVSVGMKATEVALSHPGTPILAVMVPKVAYESLIAGQQVPQGISAIYLDQPWRRQVAFLYALFPDLRQVGLLYSPETRLEVTPLLREAENHGGIVVAHGVQSADGLFASLEKVLSGSDVLLAIPDSRIYNASNIRNILLTSYRHRVPLIGFSQGYVNAGALAAIFTLPEQAAVQTANQIIAFSQGRALASPRYSDEFAISVNTQVARSLGIHPPGEEVIRKRILNTEEGR